jgi:hypothetical protein
MNETETLFEADLESLAVHEISHMLVAFSQGIPATVKMQIADDGSLSGGFCERDFAGSKFESAVVGWAGVIGEHLLNRVSRHSTPLLYPLTEATIVKWHWEALFFLNELSDGDRRHVSGHLDTLESCQHCFRILSKRTAEIRQDARLLADKTRIEREAKLAARREFEAAKKTASAWAVNPPRMSTSERAEHLSSFLDGLPANDLQRIKFAPLLDCLLRGIEPGAE